MSEEIKDETFDTTKLTEKDLEFNSEIMKEEVSFSGVSKSIGEILEVGEVPVSEVHIFMDLIKRVRSKEKINNIFAELPPTFKRHILKQMGQIDEAAAFTANPTFCNFLAKELIQDIVGNTAFDSLISEYNKEMSTVNSDLKNGKTLVSAYNDVMRETMTTKYQEIADKLRADGDEETAVYYEKLIASYKDAYNLKKLKEAIEERPSLLNRAYKEIKHYEQYAFDFSMKFCMNVTPIKNAQGEEVEMPSIKTLDAVYNALMRSGVFTNEDTAKTLCVLIYLIYSDTDISNIHEYTLLYFIIDSLYVLDRASKVGDSIEETLENLGWFENTLEEMLVNKMADKKSKKKGKK